MKGVHFGAGCDLESRITTNLFIICANNSGSTFLKNALATSRRTWNLVEKPATVRDLGAVDVQTLRARVERLSEKAWSLDDARKENDFDPV